MARMCLKCVLDLRSESHAMEKNPEKLSCALCTGRVVQPLVLCPSGIFFHECNVRTFRSLKGKSRVGMRTALNNFPLTVFDKVIRPLGVIVSQTKSKKGGVSTTVRVTNQSRLNKLLGFERYFPKQGCGAFKAMPRGEIQGVVVPVIFKHTVSQFSEHKLLFTYNTLLFNLGGRLAIPPKFPLQAKQWGKPPYFNAESYIRAEFARAPSLLLGRGVGFKMVLLAEDLRKRAAEVKADNNVWADCSPEDQEWYAGRALHFGIPPAGQELRRSARLVGKLHRRLDCFLPVSLENCVVPIP